MKNKAIIRLLQSYYSYKQRKWAYDMNNSVLKIPGQKESEVSFRFAVRNDVPLILEFIKKLASYEGYLDALSVTEELLEKGLFEEKKAEVLFVLEEGIEVGFAFFFQTFPAYPGGGAIYIDDLFVDSRCRGKGYGKALLSCIAELALERGCVRLEWNCLKWNKTSMEFYKAMGAKPLEDCVTFRMSKETMRDMCKKVRKKEN